MPSVHADRTVGLGLARHSRALTQTAPILRFAPPADARSASASLSRPPSPVLNALHEALSESILPSPPPPARLSSSPSSSRPLSRPPPLISGLRYTCPSVTSPTTSDSPVTLTLSPSPSSAATVPSLLSSLDKLRSIHTSAIPRVPVSSPNLLDGDLGKKFRTPNAPLVFCHGLLGFDSVTIGPAIAPLQVSHWRGIKEALEANGCEVLITRVPATSSPVDRAKVLEKKISETYPGRDVHLIGHSMGGIDCRYLITHLTQRTFRVISLTTIATPHRGSSFATHFLSLASAHLPAVLGLLELLPNGGGDGKAFECLTREAMKEFNSNTPDVDGVRYFSWGAEYEPGLIDTWKYPHSVIAAKEGPNDGLVSVQSAQWGTYLGTLRNVNHLDLVGWTGGLAGNLTSIAGFRDMHAFILGKDVGFSPERFYGGVADLLAGVEEEQGYVVDGQWTGLEGKEERKKGATESLTTAAATTSDKGGTGPMRRSASDQERWRMEEMLRSSPSLPESGSLISSPGKGVEGHLEMQRQRRFLPIAAQDEGQDHDVALLEGAQKAERECTVSECVHVRQRSGSQERVDPSLSTALPLSGHTRS